MYVILYFDPPYFCVRSAFDPVPIFTKQKPLFTVNCTSDIFYKPVNNQRYSLIFMKIQLSRTTHGRVGTFNMQL